ncbi:MAG: phage tail protein [Aestuariibaculum sp.]
MNKTITFLSVLAVLLFGNTLYAQDAYLGDIKLTAITFNQRGWMSCEGQLLSIAQNQALFALLGTTYGGDGITTFALPDLRGRVPVGVGQGTGLAYKTQGEQSGSEMNTLSVSQLPAHTHSVNATTTNGNQHEPTNHLPASTNLFDKEYSNVLPNTTMNANMIGSTGSNMPVNNMQPYTVVRYVICVSGIFPSRQ